MQFNVRSINEVRPALNSKQMDLTQQKCKSRNFPNKNQRISLLANSTTYVFDISLNTDKLYSRNSVSKLILLHNNAILQAKNKCCKAGF